MYKKMCDDPRIQSGWEPKVGDRFVCGNALVLYTEDFHHKHRRIYADPDEFVFWGIDEIVWLPLIEQLIDIIDTICNLDGYDQIGRLWIRLSPKIYKGLSLKELLLTVYMWEKHQARWTGERWSSGAAFL